MSVFSLPRALALGCILSLGSYSLAISPVRAQTVEETPVEAEPTSEPTRPLESESSLLSLSGAERLMAEATAAVDVEDYELAVQKLSSARRIYNQLSNFYQQLSATFQGIDIRLSDSHRALALQTAQKRDEATYQLALVHRVKQEAELAVPLLIQVVRSQNPTTPLGSKAYQQLFELGFVDTQFPRRAPGVNPSN